MSAYDVQAPDNPVKAVAADAIVVAKEPEDEAPLDVTCSERRKYYFRVWRICGVSSLGGALFGYDLGVTGGVTGMPIFLQRFYPEVIAAKAAAALGHSSAYCQYQNQGLVTWTSSMFLGGAAASLLVIPLSTRCGKWPGLGRRGVMVIGGICFLLGALLQATSKDVAMLYIGRLILGGGIGFANQAVPLYISEMAPPSFRGACNIMFQLCCTIGILVASAVNYGLQDYSWGWRLSLGLACVPAFLFTIGAALQPNTPASMLLQDPSCGEKALKVLRKVRLTSEPGLLRELDAIRASVAQTNDTKLLASCRALFSRKHGWQAAASILIPVSQQFTGMNAIMFYVSTIMQETGQGVKASLMSSVITNTVNFGATFVAVFGVDRVGRKPLLLGAGTLMAVCQFITGVIFLKQMNGGNMSRPSLIGLMAVICVFVAGFACSWGPLGWLVPSEMHTLQTRQAGMAVTVFFNFIASFAIGQGFQPMLCTMTWGVFWFFGCLILAMTGYVAFCLPETKGINVENIMGAWARVPYLPWKKQPVDEGPNGPVNGANGHA